MKSFKTLAQVREEVREEIKQDGACVPKPVSLMISVYLYFSQFGEK